MRGSSSYYQTGLEGLSVRSCWDMIYCKYFRFKFPSIGCSPLLSLSFIHSFRRLRPRIFTYRLMTLLTAPWPLPKASVEYAWVQPHKLLLSALKSVGSPAQQMEGQGRGGSERKLSEREREEEGTCLTYPQWRKINQNFLSSCCPCEKRATAGSSSSYHASSYTQLCVCALTLFFVFMHAAVCVLEYGSAWMSVYASAFFSWVSVHIILPEALWTVARQLWQAARRSAGQPRSRHVHMPMVLISGTGQRWYVTRSESRRAKSQSIAGMI